MVLSSDQPSVIEKASAERAFQQTIAREVSASGVGLHLGQQTTVRLLPADVDTGRIFIRTDLPTAQPMPARVESVIKTQLSTELGLVAGTVAGTVAGAANQSANQTANHTAIQPAKAQVRTVEHLLSALMALGIDNVRIEIDGPEVPLLDGSAKEWVGAIASAGLSTQSSPKAVRPALGSPLSVQEGDAWVAAFPSSELRFSYGIDFDLPAIGNQWHSWAAETESFAETVAPARTFGLAYQIDYLRAQGLIKGGSLDNALVCGKDGWLNPPLRFENEPARHKLLDLVGDLSLLGDIPKAHYVAYKASHSLHVALAKKLLEG